MFGELGRKRSHESPRHRLKDIIKTYNKEICSDGVD
jgi:hypothetical protein